MLDTYSRYQYQGHGLATSRGMPPGGFKEDRTAFRAGRKLVKHIWYSSVSVILDG